MMPTMMRCPEETNLFVLNCTKFSYVVSRHKTSLLMKFWACPATSFLEPCQLEDYADDIVPWSPQGIRIVNIVYKLKYHVTIHRVESAPSQVQHGLPRTGL